MLAKWSSKATGQTATTSPTTTKQEVSSPVLNNLEGQQDTTLSPSIIKAINSKAAGKTKTAVPAYKASPPFLVESLAWQDLSYYYRTQDGGKEKEKAAVKNAMGLVKRGDMVAVMGKEGGRARERKGRMAGRHHHPLLLWLTIFFVSSFFLGPSGAGKSSLFDVLARRIVSSGRLEGQVRKGRREGRKEGGREGGCCV